jgi:hypothetical protein
MIATRVTQCYASLFHPAKHNRELRHVAIVEIGPYEIRLVEMASVNSEASLWVELYDQDLRLSVDSCKCGDADAAIDAAQFLMMKAKLLVDGETGEAAASGY